MKIAPASAAPRRRRTASTPAAAQRRKCAATQKSERMRDMPVAYRLFDGHASLGGQFAHRARRQVPRDGEVTVALEALEGLARSLAHEAVCLEGAIAELGERALRGC